MRGRQPLPVWGKIAEHAGARRRFADRVEHGVDLRRCRRDPPADLIAVARVAVLAR
jgi:hypothetical protein